MPAWNILEFSVPIVKEFDAQTKAMAVKGIAINEVITRNNVKYTAEELQAAANSLQGKPILKDHSNSVDSIVGRVKTSYFDAMAKNVQFTGEILDESVKQKIESGLVNNVSIGARVKSMEKVKENDQEYVQVKGLEFLELSLVAVPGDPGASISQAFEESLKMYNTLQENQAKVDSTVYSHAQVSQETRKEDMVMEDELKALRDKVQAYETKEKTDTYARYSALCKEFGVEAETIESLDMMAMKKTIEAMEKYGIKLKSAMETRERAKVVNDAPAQVDELADYKVSMANGTVEFFKMPGDKGLHRKPLF